MRKFIKMIIWRRSIRVGDDVLIKISKGVFQKMRVVLQPSFNEVTVYNSRAIEYQNHKMKNVYPYRETE